LADISCLLLTSAWSDVKASIGSASSAEDMRATVSVTVKNTGDVTGSDVVQVYIADKASSLRRPLKELKGFHKLKNLAPGVSETVEMVLDKYAFSYWDDALHCWVAEAGEFVVIVAKSSKAEDVVAVETINLEKTFKWKGL
jgi:beta-glucosidase